MTVPEHTHTLSWLIPIITFLLGVVSNMAVHWLNDRRNDNKYKKAIIEELHNISKVMNNDHKMLVDEPLVGKALLPTTIDPIVYKEAYAKTYNSFDTYEHSYIQKLIVCLNEYNHALNTLYDSEDIYLIYHHRAYAYSKSHHFQTLIKFLDNNAKLTSYAPENLKPTAKAKEELNKLKTKFQEHNKQFVQENLHKMNENKTFSN